MGEPLVTDDLLKRIEKDIIPALNIRVRENILDVGKRNGYNPSLFT